MNELRAAVVRAIVHLNFNEPQQALDGLLLALFESNYNHSQKEISANGNSATRNA